MPKWTDDEIAYLKANRKMPYAEIGAHLGRSEQAVKAKYCMLAMDRVKVPQWADKDLDTLRAGVAAGDTDAVIAKRIKRTANAVRQKRLLLGLKVREA
jgi:hypothetical protein